MAVDVQSKVSSSFGQFQKMKPEKQASQELVSSHSYAAGVLLKHKYLFLQVRCFTYRICYC